MRGAGGSPEDPARALSLFPGGWSLHDVWRAVPKLLSPAGCAPGMAPAGHVPVGATGRWTWDPRGRPCGRVLIQDGTMEYNAPFLHLMCLSLICVLVVRRWFAARARGASEGVAVSEQESEGGAARGDAGASGG